jgi:glycosyltransferase involved in cell wall biosynthesis
MPSGASDMQLTEEQYPKIWNGTCLDGVDRTNHTLKATRKVLHLINGEHFSGAERVQDLLALRLPEFGYEVGFACVKPDKFPQLRHSTDSDLHEVAMKSRFDLACVNRVVALARQHGYAALHAHTPRTLLVARLVAAKLHCPLIYHVHSPVGRDSNRGLSNRINTWLETWCLKRFTKIVCVSNSLAEYMRSLGHPAHKLCVVGNGVATVVHLPNRRVPNEPWVLGVMALFRPRKGLEVLLDAVHILIQRGIPVRLRAVGAFETEGYQKEIMSRVTRLGIAESIEWTGFQVDVNDQLRKMDLFVLPSLYGEGMPMVVLEAMANAIPVVASRVEGIPEVIRHDIDGLIVEPGDPIDLVNRLHEIIGDVRRWKMMSRSSFDRQRRDFSDVSMARSLAAVYDEIFANAAVAH